MDLYEIIRCVRRRFLVFAIVAVAVIAAGAAYALTQKQTYESTTTLQFGPKKETVAHSDRDPDRRHDRHDHGHQPGDHLRLGQGVGYADLERGARRRAPVVAEEERHRDPAVRHLRGPAGRARCRRTRSTTRRCSTSPAARPTPARPRRSRTPWRRRSSRTSREQPVRDRRRGLHRPTRRSGRRCRPT